jgi:hypothetical protein
MDVTDSANGISLAVSQRVNHLDRLYFLHIPKTAGTSVRSWLGEFFPHDELLPADHLAELEAMDDETIRKFRFASGHFGWRYVERAERAGLTIPTVTYLRDAVELIFSALAYASQFASEDLERLGEQEVAMRMFRDLTQSKSLASVVRTITQPEFEQYQNMMVGFLAGAGTQAKVVHRKTTTDLLLAKQRLDEMPFFGLTENMAWSNVLFCEAFAFPLIPLDAKYNTGGNFQATDLPPELIAVYRRLHDLDEELFQFSRELFDKRVQAVCRRHGVPPDAKPDDLAAPLMRQFLQTEHNVDPIAHARISLGDGVICPGFQPRFYWDAAQRWVRWTGPALKSSVCLPLDRSQSLTLEFEFIAFLATDIRDELRVELGGATLPLRLRYEQQADGSYRALGQVEVPPDATVATYTALDFIVPRTMPSTGLSTPSSFALADIRVSPSAPGR